MYDKSLSSAFLILVFFSGLILVGAAPFSSVQASTEVKGILSSDTTWTKVDSPYNLTGNLLVSDGVTLTIEPGVTVNLNDYYMQVNGTLHARGTSTEAINITTGEAIISPYFAILFTQSSRSWNEQTGSGCIIENANLNLKQGLRINNASPKISNNVIRATIKIEQGAPILHNNKITGISNGGSIIIEGGSPVISNNDINSRDSIEGQKSPFVHYGISFYGCSSAYIDDNTIQDFRSGGIGMFPGVGPETGTPIIERNLITNNPTGIDIRVQAIIVNNTISGNSIGIEKPDPSSTIAYNNFLNSEYNLHLQDTSSNVEATHNWWGTTDTQAISQTIYDFEDDFNLGKVNFSDFLTAQNPQALPDPNVPIPKPQPTPTSSPPPNPSPIPVPGQSYFYVESNSTVSELFFNSTNAELSFTVTGENGTAGYVEITIAKSLVSSVQNVKVYLDGSQLEIAITEDGDTWLLRFNYLHSEHQVTVSLATEEPQLSPSEITLIVAIVAVVLGLALGVLIVFAKRK